MAVNTSIDERGVYPVRADGQTTTTLTINVDTICQILVCHMD